MSLGALLLASASSATHASAARPGGFDPASTLPWSVPFLLVVPVMAYVLLLFSVRSRRGAANVAMGTVVVMLALTLLVAWARFRQRATYKTSYQWINVPVSFTGEQRFP